MEPSILNIGDWTDQATKQLLQLAVNKKRKFDKFKKYHLFFVWWTVITAFLFLYYINETVIEPYADSFQLMISAFVDNPIHLYMVLVVGGSFGGMNVLKKKRTKAEDEYHELRREIVDRSKDLWKYEDAWKKRHLVLDMMKKEFNINLYHETK
ncbi:YpbF family protein [Bacillus litorisediminis]|uniref:YpbF family protein n=1 Tax=Bacillus litorisediminis TaxID=2922713 RepID=UPI001FAD93F4|nr:YpbF family protein [Bacillus litorisediminis]